MSEIGEAVGEILGTWDEDDPQRCVKTRDNEYRWEGQAKRLFGGVA